MSTIPSHLRYSAEHEWVDESSPVKVGLSAVAADSLGDVVYLDLPEAGSSITAGEVCGEVESTKSVSDVYAPVAGVVAAVNDVLDGAPETINADPYGTGWLFEISVPGEGGDPIGALLDADAYQALVDGS